MLTWVFVLTEAAIIAATIDDEWSLDGGYTPTLPNA